MGYLWPYSERGLQLNAPEAKAIIADVVAGAARDGLRLAEPVERGRSLLGPDDVLDGLVGLVDEVCVETTFDDGTRLQWCAIRSASSTGRIHTGGITSHRARSCERRGSAGGGSRRRSRGHRRDQRPDQRLEPSPLLRGQSATAIRPGCRLRSAPGDRPGTTISFEPGATVRVELVAIGGARVVIGFAGFVDGPLDARGARERSLDVQS